MLDLDSKCYIQTSLATSWIWYIKVLKHCCNQSWSPFQHCSLIIIYKQTLSLTSSHIIIGLFDCMYGQESLYGIRCQGKLWWRGKTPSQCTCKALMIIYCNIGTLPNSAILAHLIDKKVEIARQRRSWWTVTIKCFRTEWQTTSGWIANIKHGDES